MKERKTKEREEEESCKGILSKSGVTTHNFKLHRRRRRRRRAREERGTPLLVVPYIISDRTKACLFIVDDAPYTPPPLPPPLGLDVKDFRTRYVTFNPWRDLDYYGGELDYTLDYSSHCRDLMCFSNSGQVCVYSPSTNKYLHFHYDIRLEPNEFKVGIAYIADLNVYKIVILEVLPGYEALCAGWNVDVTLSQSVRFTSITVEEEEEHGGGGGIHNCDVVVDDERNSWELICEHRLPSFLFFTGQLGNLIGVNGSVYAIIDFSKPPPDDSYHIERKVLSLDLKDKKFQILNLPHCCFDKTCCFFGSSCETLSQVKDLLCYPHKTTSTIDLWLLKDGNTCTWFKGYTINYIPPRGRIAEVVYFPPDDDDDDDDDAGTFLFDCNKQLFQYDIRTKETVCMLDDCYYHKFHVVTDRPFSMKNGLKCPDIHSLPPQGSLPPHHNLQQQQQTAHWYNSLSGPSSPQPIY